MKKSLPISLPISPFGALLAPLLVRVARLVQISLFMLLVPAAFAQPGSGLTMEPKLPEVIPVPAPPNVKAEGYLLMDAATGEALVEFNADERLPPASLTKIMTAYVAASELERGSISADDQVLVSIKAWQTGGSRMFIDEGTRIGLMDLLRGVIIQSGNDASIAVAEHVAGTEESFVQVMNHFATQLGMSNTSFTNATGLPDENHYTTANDLAKLTMALIANHPEHYKIYAEKLFTWNDIRQPNRNRLLWRDSSVDGVKTGHTEAAGYCLIASALRGNTRFISVVMGASSEDARETETRRLLSWGFRYYETAHLFNAEESLRHLRVWGGIQGSVHIGLSEALALTIPRQTREYLSAELTTAPEIHAPVAAGEALGQLTVTLHDGSKVKRPLIALSMIEEKGFFGGLVDTISRWLLKIFGGDPLEVPA